MNTYRRCFSAISTLAMASVVSACALFGAPETLRPTLYERLGGEEGIDLIVDEALRQMAADPLLQPSFVDVSAFDYPRFKYNFTQQLCEIADGPCRYRGKDMREAHRGLQISQAQFDRSGLIIQRALQRFEVDRDAQNEVLRRLGALGPDIVGR